MTLHHPPNFKLFDHPPAKKPRTSGATATAPNVHIAVNFASMPEAMKGSYTVSDAPIESTSAPGPSCPASVQVSNSAAQPHSAPLPHSQPYRPRGFPTKASLIPTLLECLRAKRVPTTHELLALMDAYDPSEDLKFVDALSEMEDHEIEDALHIYSLPVGHLASLGNLGRSGAGRFHQFTRDSVLEPLGFLETVQDTAGNRDAVEVVSVDDDSVELVKKEDSVQDTMEFFVKKEDSVELVVKKEDSVELVEDDEDSVELVAEDMSDDTHVSVPISHLQHQEIRKDVLRWLEGGSRGGSENEDGTVLYSDVDDRIDDVAARRALSG